LTEAEWTACSSPYEMLSYLDGKVEVAEIVRFNVACCRRIWPLIPDPQSRAVIEATERWLAGAVSSEDVQRVFDEWSVAYKNGAVSDHVGGNTNAAIICVSCGWLRYATSLVGACADAVGYAASEPLRQAGAPQLEIASAWCAAADAEKAGQCRLLRELFECVPTTDIEPRRTTRRT
jgi:hypothetical protein